MNDFLYLFLALIVGFAHSFEADHLVAVFNLVSKPNTTKYRIKEGLFWGIGHSLTILFIGCLILIIKVNLNEIFFSGFESMVGLMLLILGVYRLVIVLKSKSNNKAIVAHSTGKHTHKLALSIGTLHGLAGSGSVVALAISKTNSGAIAFTYLIVFGIGSIIGMFLSSYVLGKFMTIKILEKYNFPLFFAIFSSLICIVIGSILLFENLKI